MRYLGIDIGSRRTGLAISDATGLIARPFDVLLGAFDGLSLAQRLAPIIETEDVDVLVVGLPRRLGGEEGPEAESVRLLAEQLHSTLETPVELWDERLSTVEATQRLIAAGMRRDKRKKVVDKVAAAIILQSYLDAVGNGSHRHP